MIKIYINLIQAIELENFQMISFPSEEREREKRIIKFPKIH